MSAFDAKIEIERITSFLKETFHSASFSDAVIGLSGGVDSAVSFFLAVRALGVDRVYPVLLPYGALSTQGVLDAMECVTIAKVPLSHLVRIDIQPAVDIIARTSGASFDQLRKGNIMARVRMTYLFDQAKKRNALVVGTENRSEYELGYFTRFGDEASDIEPIQHLLKREVYELGRALVVPQKILEKIPSADLWPGQTDEGELGFTYQEVDEVLQNREIVLENKEHATEKQKRIIQRMEHSAFKRQKRKTL